MKHRPIDLLAVLALGIVPTPSQLFADSPAEDFIRHEAAANGSAVRIAEVGVERAVRPEVRAFAEQLAADHKRVGTELADLAKRKGVALGDLSSDRDDDDHHDLAETDKEDFDKTFLAAVVDHREDSIENLEEASKDAEDAEVKAWAAKMLPGLTSHHERAKALQGEGKEQAAATKTASADADNARRNMRDRDGDTLTPIDQGNSQADIDMTARIRKEVLARDGLSVNAQNAKIITKDGRVTLRGPVASAEEKTVLGEIATKAAGGAVDNQLEVATDKADKADN